MRDVKWGAGWRALLLVSAILIYAATSASATSGKEVDVTCPVCGLAFRGWTWTSTNSFGGVDRDFCEHAVGGQVFLSAVWTCPRCAYTGMPDAWDPKSTPAALVERLKKENPLKPAQPIDPKVRLTTEIPAWIRWDLLRQVQELEEGVPVIERANTCLRMAWTQRFELEVPAALSAEVSDLTGDYLRRVRTEGEPRNAYREAMDAATAMLRDAAAAGAPLTRRERQVRIAAAAALLLSRGEGPAAAGALDRLDSAEPRVAGLEALAAEIRTRLAREMEALGRAAPLFAQALRDGSVGEESPLVLRYLLGEIHRKLLDPAKARTLLEPLPKEAGLPDWLGPWIADALSKIAEAEKRAGR